MIHTFNLLDIIGSEVLSRSNMRAIEDAAKDALSQVVVNFRGVEFISRSFADELCDVEERYVNVHIEHLDGEAAVMHDIVKRSRSTKRVRISSDAKIKRIDNLKELSAVLRNDF